MPNRVRSAYLFQTYEARDGSKFGGNKEIADLGECRLRRGAISVVMMALCFIIALEDAGLKGVYAEAPIVSFVTATVIIIVFTGQMGVSEIWECFFA